MTYLQLEQVEHTYGRQVILPPLDCTMEKGDFICLLGPSGSGKTTLLRLIAGLEKLRKGRITLEGTVWSSPDTHVTADCRGVGMVFQQPTLFPTLDVRENVAFGIRHVPLPERMARVDALLSHVGLADYASRFPHQLSGGQQHRVALARALAPSPKLLLLDEPFAHLDTPLRSQLRVDTLALMKAEKVTAIMVTHDPEEAMLMGDQIVVLDAQGRLQQSGSPHDIYRAPANAYVAQALGEINVLNGQGDGVFVQTPLGRYASPLKGDVRVVARPHDCEIVDTSKGIAAQVMLIHCAGAQDYLTLKLTSGEVLRASLPHSHRFTVGDHVGVRVADESLYVFTQ